MPDVSVNSLLNTIWSLFNRVGITDSFVIIEHIAALLTENQPQPLRDLQPRIPPRREGLEIDEIKRLLHQAAEAAGGEATLFDRYVIFRLRERLSGPGGHYPTPRHIVEFMRHLVHIEASHRLADFACGTGGFLVAREKNEPQAKEVVGVDNSPEWARLAWANTRLHSDRTANIIIGDPFRVCSKQGELSGQVFDRFLMNPPFGVSIDADLAREVVGHETGGNSETGLTALALHVLPEDGRAAILVPTGLLFSKNAGEKGLRERLVGIPDDRGYTMEEYNLEAVISLPGDALQPYSSLQTHMLLVSKGKVDHPSQQQSVTWFFQAERDGYPAGRKRDITALPTIPNDLTFMEEVLRSRGNYLQGDQTFPAGSTPVIGVKKIGQEGTAPGVVIEALHGTPFSRFTYFPTKEGQTPAFFLAEAAYLDNGQNQIYVSIVLGEDIHTDTDDDKLTLLKRLYGVSDEKHIPLPIPLLQEHEYGQAIAINKGNRILGCAVFARGIANRDCNLQPKSYVKTISETRTIEPPAVLLGRVRRSQNTFLEQIDGLLGRLELKPIAGQQLPSALRNDIHPLTRLSKEQNRLWQRICNISEKRRETMNGLFTLEDVRSSDTYEATRLTLDLFERMGVIVPVTIIDPNEREALSAIFYRRVTEQDMWV